MLSEDDRRRIEAEELAALRGREAVQARARTRLAEHAYRREVLRPRPAWWPLRWGLLFVPVAAAAVWAWRPAPALPDPGAGTGGIGREALIAACRGAVAEALGAAPATLRLPGAREAEAAISTSPDGRRWDGWAEGPDGRRVDFACTYTAADGQTVAELLEDR